MTQENLLELAQQRQQELQAQLQQMRQEKAQPGRYKRYRLRPWEKDEPQPPEEEETWFVTYLDMMTLLLVLMIVMLSFAGQRAANQTASSASTSTQLADSGQGLLPAGAGLFPVDGLPPKQSPDYSDIFEGLGDDIDVLVGEQTISFRVNSEILFGSGQADLSREGLQVMRQLAEVINALEYQVSVEGHTDSVPMRSHRFPSNWELSGARAGSVVRYLQANGVHGERLKAIGYADTRPLAANDTAAGRATNRRVELIMEKPAQPQEKQADLGLDLIQDAN